MRKLLIATAAGLTLFIAWISLRRHETWVVPKITVAIKDAGGDSLSFERFDLRVINDDQGAIRWDTGEHGTIEIEPVTALKRGGIGNPCYVTSLELSVGASHVCSEEVRICGGELSGKHPPSQYRVEFVIGQPDSKERCTAVVQRLY